MNVSVDSDSGLLAGGLGFLRSNKLRGLPEDYWSRELYFEGQKVEIHVVLDSRKQKRAHKRRLPHYPLMFGLALKKKKKEKTVL